MFKRFFKYSVASGIFVATFSCSDKNNKPVIKFSGDSTSIIIKNIDEASLLQVKNAYQANADTVNILSVLLQPGELDSIQDEQEVPGKVKVAGDSLIFKPDQPFVAGKDYRVESYIGVKFATVGNMLSGKVKHNLQPQKQTLKR